MPNASINSSFFRLNQLTCETPSMLSSNLLSVSCLREQTAPSALKCWLTQLQRPKLFSLKFRPHFRPSSLQHIDSQWQQSPSLSLESFVIPTPAKNMSYLCGMYFTSVTRFSLEHGRMLPYYKIKELRNTNGAYSIKIDENIIDHLPQLEEKVLGKNHQ